MVAKLVLGEKNIKENLHPTANVFFFKSICPLCNPSSN
jgi:hypothetical protein